MFQAAELAVTQASLQERMEHIQSKEDEVNHLYTELKDAKEKASEKETELTRIVIETQQRETELKEQLLVRSEVHSNHGGENEEQEGDDQKEFGMHSFSFNEFFFLK